jgi:hypothetical protein
VPYFGYPPWVLTCPVCGRFDASQPARQTWDQGRSLVPRVARSYRDGRYEVREWTEEVLTPLARRVAPPEPPPRRWILGLAAGSLLFALFCAGSDFVVHAKQAITLGLVGAPGLVVLYILQKVRSETKVVRAQALWEQTWYCHGCDHVWLPGSGRRPMPSHSMRRMLWRYS